MTSLGSSWQAFMPQYVNTQLNKNILTSIMELYYNQTSITFNSTFNFLEFTKKNINLVNCVYGNCNLLNHRQAINLLMFTCSQSIKKILKLNAEDGKWIHSHAREHKTRGHRLSQGWHAKCTRVFPKFNNMF